MSKITIEITADRITEKLELNGQTIVKVWQRTDSGLSSMSPGWHDDRRVPMHLGEAIDSLDTWYAMDALKECDMDA